jgi:hypothetical protein
VCPVVCRCVYVRVCVGASCLCEESRRRESAWLPLQPRVVCVCVRLPRGTRVCAIACERAVCARVCSSVSSAVEPFPLRSEVPCVVSQEL